MLIAKGRGQKLNVTVAFNQWVSITYCASIYVNTDTRDKANYKLATIGKTLRNLL